MKNGLNCSCDCVWSDCGLINDHSPGLLLSLSLPRPSLVAPPGLALLTIVSLRLLGQLGLVDLVFSVGHLGVVLAVVLTGVSHFTVTMIRLALAGSSHHSALVLAQPSSPHWHKMELCPGRPGPG